jgi:hypothetical protein
MGLEQTGAIYEFDRDENAIFTRLANAMTFVGIAEMAIGVLVAVGVAALNSSFLGVVLVGVLSIAFMAMGLLRCAAARHFRRIVVTQGHDREDLIAALVELTETYELQRWLWMFLAAVILIGLEATRIGWSL